MSSVCVVWLVAAEMAETANGINISHRYHIKTLVYKRNKKNRTKTPALMCVCVCMCAYFIGDESGERKKTFAARIKCLNTINSSLSRYVYS